MPQLTIPLELRGVISCFPTHKPTSDEYLQCQHYELTADHPIFDPHTIDLTSQELAANESIGRDYPTGDRSKPRRLLSVEQLPTNRDEENFFHQALANSVQVSSLRTKEQRQGITAEQLATNWGIGFEAAQRTLKVTTQRGICTFPHPSLTRRYPTNDRQLRYRRLPFDLYTDTMKATVPSKLGNRYAQVYASRNGWTRAHPMRLRSQAHETFSLLCARDGVPSNNISNGWRTGTNNGRLPPQVS
jgi:hypothetical protein